MSTKIETEGKENGRFWIVIQRAEGQGQEGLAVTTLRDEEYYELMTDFNVNKLGAEVVMAHRC